MDDGPLTEKEKAREFASLKYGSLAVLAGDHQPHLEGCPFTLPLSGVVVEEGLFLDGTGLLYKPRLPGVEDQPGEGGKLNYFPPQASDAWRQGLNPRRLVSERTCAV